MRTGAIINVCYLRHTGGTLICFKTVLDAFLYLADFHFRGLSLTGSSGSKEVPNVTIFTTPITSAATEGAVVILRRQFDFSVSI